MIIKTTSLAFAAACLMMVSGVPAALAQTAGGPPQLVTNGPQTDAGDVSPSWSAPRNVIESERYDRLLETSGAFREVRMRKECGPITDPQLRAECFASFNQDEPYAGSSTPPRSYRSGYGR